MLDNWLAAVCLLNAERATQDTVYPTSLQVAVVPILPVRTFPLKNWGFEASGRDLRRPYCLIGMVTRVAMHIVAMRHSFNV